MNLYKLTDETGTVHCVQAKTLNAATMHVARKTFAVTRLNAVDAVALIQSGVKLQVANGGDDEPE